MTNNQKPLFCYPISNDKEPKFKVLLFKIKWEINEIANIKKNIYIENI